MEDGSECNSISENLGETLETQLPSLDRDSSHESNRCSIDVDPVEFVHFLAHTGWPDEQKLEYATLVLGIVRQFAEIGHNVHPLQLVRNFSGKPAEFTPERTGKPPKMLGSPHSKLIEEFMRLGTIDQHQGEEESHL